VDDAGLHDGQRPDRADRVGQALEAVAYQDADVLDTAVLDFGEDLQPVRGALAAVTGPQPQDVPLPGHGDPDGDVDGWVDHLAGADPDHDDVDEHHRLDPVQRSVQPITHLLKHPCR
jgi:hypothetical protein